MTKFEPCPFCHGSGEVVSALTVSGNYMAGIRCTACGARTGMVTAGDESDAIVIAAACWNTRYERTCEMVMNEGTPTCSACFRELIFDSKYCDGCGAKVVSA